MHGRSISCNSCVWVDSKGRPIMVYSGTNVKYHSRQGCGPVHKPFAYHAEALRSFPGGDNATPQTAEQT